MHRLITLSFFFIPFLSYSQVEIVRTGSYDSARLELVFDYKGEKVVYDVLANNPYNFLPNEVYKINHVGNKVYNPDSVWFNNQLYTGNDLYFSSRSSVHTAGVFGVVAYQLIFSQTLHDEGPPTIDSQIAVIENGYEEFSFKVNFGFYGPKISPNGKYIALSWDEETYTKGFKLYDIQTQKFIYEVDGSHNGIRQRGDLFVIPHYPRKGGLDLYCFDTSDGIMYRKHFEERGKPIDYGENNSFTRRSDGVLKTYTLQDDFEKIPLN